MAYFFIVLAFILGGFVSMYFVSTVAEDSGLEFPEDKVFDRRL